MARAWGIVNSDGTGVLDSSSQNWSSALTSTGLYRVQTRLGRDAMPYGPVPVVCVLSGNLSTVQQGKTNFINVTDVGQDDSGDWYFGVAINNKDSTLTNSSFSFTVEAAA